MSRGRLMISAVVAACAMPAGAQVSIGPNGVRSGNTVIDASGVHTATADVGARGAQTRRSSLGGTTIRTNGQTRSIDCRGKALTLDGNNNRLTLSRCATILVNGNSNDVTASFAAPGRLSVMGNSNTVRWQAAQHVHVAVSNLGNQNVITRRQAA